jgi:hypothetical protein
MIKIVRTLLVGSLTILLIGMADAGGPVAVALPGSPAGAAAAGKPSKPDKEALVGSWEETFVTSFVPSKSLVTFHGDGTMTNSDQGGILANPFPFYAAQTLVFSDGHGAWIHLDKRSFAYKQVELLSDESGNLLGYLRVRGIYTVTDDGDKYNGSSTFVFTDVDNNALLTGDASNAGVRIQVELP